MTHHRIDDGTPGGQGFAVGTGHPDAPADRPIGLQVYRYNTDSSEFDSVTVYMSPCSAAALAGILAAHVALKGEPEELWIVGRTVGEESAPTWAFQGVFSTKDAALEACRDQTYFIAPATLDKSIPHESQWWPGSYFPLVETKEQADARAAELPEPPQ